MDNFSIQKLSKLFQDYLYDQGMVMEWAIFLNVIVNFIIILIVVLFIAAIAKRIIVKTFLTFSNKTKSTFDDYLVTSNFPRYIAQLFPLALVWYLIPLIFNESPIIANAFQVIAKGYLIVLGVYIFRSVLRSTRKFLEGTEKYHDKPIESYIQVLMMFAWGVAIFWIVQLLTGFSIISLTTLGAASAVILLIFKDTILGFVASIQVSVNDIVRIGDWITFSKFGADGTVTEINLATVRVQNFDNTFTTIPTYSLIADSFQNWRGMQESGGRRIKRSLYIKQSSIRFLAPDEIERLKEIHLLKPYLEHRQKDIDNYNSRNEIDKKVLINGRNQTNLGVFRHYINAVLNENSAINKDLYLMVRHLAPTEKGLPLEIYCFSKDKRWVNYEHIQADIFDHLLAAIKYFNLEVFELPTGKDLQKMVEA